jgi:hypothetical protein
MERPVIVGLAEALELSFFSLTESRRSKRLDATTSFLWLQGPI